MLFWLFGVAVLSFALTLNIKVTGAVLIAGFAFYFIAVPRIKSGKNSGSDTN